MVRTSRLKDLIIGSDNSFYQAWQAVVGLAKGFARGTVVAPLNLSSLYALAVVNAASSRWGGYALVEGKLRRLHVLSICVAFAYVATLRWDDSVYLTLALVDIVGMYRAAF